MNFHFSWYSAPSPRYKTWLR